MSLSSCITSAVNSEPLSDCITLGAPNNRNISSSWNAASAALLDVSHICGKSNSKLLFNTCKIHIQSC